MSDYYSDPTKQPTNPDAQSAAPDNTTPPPLTPNEIGLYQQSQQQAGQLANFESQNNNPDMTPDQTQAMQSQYQPIPGTNFYDDPSRIVRDYHAQTDSPSSMGLVNTNPTWMDQPGINAAYNALAQYNQGNPDTTWQAPPTNDPKYAPYYQLTAQLPVPPVEAMKPNEVQQFGTWSLTDKQMQASGMVPMDAGQAQQVFTPDQLQKYQTMQPANPPGPNVLYVPQAGWQPLSVADEMVDRDRTEPAGWMRE